MALRTELRVLVVDDMAVSRQILGQMLDHLGVRRVQTCSSAAEALAALGRQPFDVVISDLVMPGIDGLELLRRMRRIARCRDTAFVLTSGTDASPRFAEAGRLGLRGLLIKPFRIDLLLNCLERTCGRI